jgi:hypothetical protein
MYKAKSGWHIALKNKKKLSRDDTDKRPKHFEGL